MITLYIKTHNKTGLKYFGKTTRNDYHSYTGSGVYWLRHLDKHGNDYTTEVYAQSDDKEYLKELAIKFSKDNDIVESTGWANLTIENLSGGGNIGDKNGMFGKTHTEEVKIASSERIKNKVGVKDKDGNTFMVDKNDERYIKGELVPLSKGRKNKYKNHERQEYKGKGNPKAKHIGVFNKDNELMFECFGNFQQTIKKYGLPKNALNQSLSTGIPLYTTNHSLSLAKRYGYEIYQGWYAKYL